MADERDTDKRDKVLSLVREDEESEPGDARIIQVVRAVARAAQIIQRDADLVILKRDWVSKAALARLLVEVRKINLECADSIASEFYDSWEQIEALAQLGMEVKP